jgi:hypothetical protein
MKQHPLSEIYLKFATFREFSQDRSSDENFYSKGRFFHLRVYIEGCNLTQEKRIKWELQQS